MSFEKLKTTPTVVLISLISEASEKGDQSLINIYAYELATRIWVPNQTTTFTEMLEKFGYRETEDYLKKKK